MAAYYATIVVKFIPFSVDNNSTHMTAVDTYLSSATVDGAVIGMYTVEGGLIIVHGTTA